MGCFNYSCGISSGTIGYTERAGLVLIVPNKTSRDRDCVFQNDLYMPVCPPIYGKYNDYGSLEAVERTPAVEYVEWKYGTSIEGVLAALQSDSPYDDRMHPYFFSETPLPYDRNDTYNPVNSDDFERWGFTKTDDGWERGDCTLVEEDNTYIVKAEDRIKTIYPSSKPSFLEEYHAHTGQWIGLSSEEGARFTALAELSAMYFLPSVYDALLASGALSGYCLSNHFDLLVEGIKETIADKDDWFWGSRLADKYFVREVLHIAFPADYAHMAKHPEAWKPLWHLCDMLRATHHTWMPPIMGEQAGNLLAERAVAKVLVARADAWEAEWC